MWASKVKRCPHSLGYKSTYASRNRNGIEGDTVRKFTMLREVWNANKYYYKHSHMTGHAWALLITCLTAVPSLWIAISQASGSAIMASVIALIFVFMLSEWFFAQDYLDNKHRHTKQ